MLLEFDSREGQEIVAAEERLAFLGEELLRVRHRSLPGAKPDVPHSV
jgi:hypothetical protein